MKIFLIVLMFLLSGYQSGKNSHKQDVQDIINQVINSEEIAKFVGHYTSKNEAIYFLFGPSPVYSKQALQELKPIVLKIKNSAPLIYDESQDENKKPVITVQILKLEKNSAAVRIGFPIEGMVGEFTLVKSGTWDITKSDVYEI